MMSNYIEFLYDHGSAIDRAREVWDAGSDDSVLDVSVPPSYPDDEFLAGKEFFVSVDYRDVYGNLRPNDPNDGDHTDFAPAVPCLELLLAHEELTWDGFPVVEEVTGMLQLVKAVYRATDTPPAYVYGLSYGHSEVIRRGARELPITEADLAENRICGPSWLMLFPPALVETYGREVLLNAPVWHAEELDDGAILLVVVENPAELGTPDLDEVAEYFHLPTYE